jgi:hypothetical protein
MTKVDPSYAAGMRGVLSVFLLPTPGLAFANSMSSTIEPLEFERDEITASWRGDVRALSVALGHHRLLALRTVYIVDYKSSNPIASIYADHVCRAVYAIAGSRGAEVIVVGMQEIIEACRLLGIDEQPTT